MEIGCSNKVVARNSFGQFRGQCSRAATKTIQRAIEDGAQMSRDIAPRGSGDDPRTIPLHESIVAIMDSGNSGHWEATARHALPVEFGSAAHTQTVKARFFWEKMGRDWDPREWYPGQQINHPAVGAQPYLRPAYKATMQRIMAIARRYYPG